MRGDDNQQAGIFSYVSPEKRVPADHPLRPIRKMVDEILKEMSPQFAKLYSHSAPSAPGCGPAVSGGAGSGSGLSATDHCRSRSHGRNLSFGQAAPLMGGRLP